MTSLLRIAARNVLRNRRRSLITLAAMFIALGILTTARGFLNGFQSSLRESVVLGQTGALQIHKKGFLKSVNSAPLEQALPADDALLAKIRAVPGVTAVTPRIYFGAMTSVGDTTGFAAFTAIDPRQELRVCPRRMEMTSSGRTLAEAGPDSAVFTPELATRLGLRVGQKAAILANDKDGVLNALDVELVGLYGQAGLPLPDKKFGYVPLALAQQLLRMPSRATELAVAVANVDDVDRLKTRLQAALGPELEVSTWHEAAPWLDDAIAMENKLLNLLAGIFLFVALLGIVNTMLMSVFERTREIGTMMSVGVRRRQILTLFLLEASLLGVAGGILGALAGSALVVHLGHKGIALKMAGMLLPLHVHPWITLRYLLFIPVLATVSAALAAFWPSLRASRLRPVEALGAV